MKQNYITIFALSLSLMLFNCKKANIESDTIKPSVSINSPSSGDEFAIGEVIALSAVFKDDTKLKSCSITISYTGEETGEGSSWTPDVVVIPLSDTLQTVNEEIFGTIPVCKTGEYTIHVEVSDAAEIANITQTDIKIKIIPTAPEITVEEPVEGSSYIVGEDFFIVKVSCSDNEELKELVCNVVYTDAGESSANLKVATGVDDPWSPGEKEETLSGDSQDVLIDYGQIAPSVPGNYKLVLDLYDTFDNKTTKEVNFILIKPDE